MHLVHFTICTGEESSNQLFDPDMTLSVRFWPNVQSYLFLTVHIFQFKLKN